MLNEINNILRDFDSLKNSEILKTNVSELLIWFYDWDLIKTCEFKKDLKIILNENNLRFHLNVKSDRYNEIPFLNVNFKSIVIYNDIHMVKINDEFDINLSDFLINTVELGD